MDFSSALVGLLLSIEIIHVFKPHFILYFTLESHAFQVGKWDYMSLTIVLQYWNFQVH